MARHVPEADHIELTVQRMAELHACHVDAQTPMQRHVSRATRWLSTPRAVPGAIGLVLVWIVVNAGAPSAGFRPFDAAPFNLLELVATLVALLTTLMILATQAREEEAARHRSQLTLQLASLSEQKIAKVIGLLEEQRRESAHPSNRADPEAEQMAHPSDPGHVLDRIKKTHEQ